MQNYVKILGCLLLVIFHCGCNKPAPKDPHVVGQLADVITQRANGKTTFNSAGQPTLRTYPDGSKLYYDSHGDPTELITAKGEKTKYKFNEQGNITETIYPDGTSEK